MNDCKDEAISLEVDVENLKVIEIKKRLKALGLPVTGNKPELVERLQLALITGRASPDSAGDSTPSKVKDNKDSLEVMFEESQDMHQSQEVGQSEDADESENFDESEELDLSQEVAQSQEVGQSQDADQSRDVASVSTSVPSNKRALPQDEVEAVKPRKRIILKRNNFPTPILAAKVEKDDEGEAVVSQSCDITGMSTESGKNIIKLTAVPKYASEAEKAEKRAIRFNMSGEEMLERSVAILDRDKNFAALFRKQTPKRNREKKPMISMSAPVPSIDVLKKRGARFGENVSSVLKKMEVEEKLNQRKLKFGQKPISTKDSDTGEEEKKKKRAERFGKL